MQLHVKQLVNLTPDCDDKTIYHLVLTPQAGETLHYAPGDWLTLTVSNQPEWVEALLQRLQLSGDELVEVRRAGQVTSRVALSEHLEISQLNPAILNKLQRQYQLGDWADRQAMIDYAYGRDILDLLEAFPALCERGVEFLTLLSPLAPRYYSIASAQAAVGNEVHLLIRLVAYQNAAASGRMHYGVASFAVSQLQIGEAVEAELKANPTFKLPANHQTPIIMLGAGTGLAPYIAFMQQRVAQPDSGQNWLFFGETHQACSFLFGEQLQAWAAQGQLQLNTAFSRDQAQKQYVQHEIVKHQSELWDWLQQGAHLYLCGSQEQLAKGVEAAFIDLFRQCGEMSEPEARDYWQALRKARRLQLDVY